MYEIRPIEPDEFPAFRRAGDAAFGHQPSDEDIEADRAMLELDRTLAAYDAGRIVGTATAFSFELTLPGPTTGATGETAPVVPVAAVTSVGVLPTHRRRGILRALMQRQLEDVRARGESMAVLTTSESVIYGRFGYGLATSAVGIDIDVRHGAFARPVVQPEGPGPGRLALLDHDRVHEVVPPAYDRIRRRQPGALGRTAAYWQRLLSNPSAPMDGAGGRFCVAYESATGQVDGVAIYRVRSQWTDGIAGGALLLRDLFTATPEAYAALWQYLFGLDLIVNVQCHSRPVDEPLRWLLADPRRLRVTRLSDDLWLRVVDVPKALSARRYGRADSLVLELSDPFLPRNTGRYALEGGPDGASCRPTTADADLDLTVADLGAILLGGVSAGTLARASRVVERSTGALRRADALFASDPAPYCGTPF